MDLSVPALNPSGPVAGIRRRKLDQRIMELRAQAQQLLDGFSGGSVWLFGSLARGDWDAFSDVDMLVIATSQEFADRLADAVLVAGLADDVLALTANDWQRQQQSIDPYWSAIAKDAQCLVQT